MNHAKNGKKLRHRVEHIGEIARENTFFRRVLFPGEFGQLALMSRAPGEEMGETEYHDGDCFVSVLEGRAR